MSVYPANIFSSLPQYPRHFLQRPAHAQQLVFAEDDEAFVLRVFGGAHELDDFRIDRDFLASCVGHGDEGDHMRSFGLVFALPVPRRGATCHAASVWAFNVRRAPVCRAMYGRG
jgi:hypothetical protein